MIAEVLSARCRTRQHLTGETRAWRGVVKVAARCITANARERTPPIDFRAQEKTPWPGARTAKSGRPLPSLALQTASVRGYRGSAAHVLQSLEHPAHSGYPEEYDQNPQQDH